MTKRLVFLRSKFQTWWLEWPLTHRELSTSRKTAGGWWTATDSIQDTAVLSGISALPEAAALLAEGPAQAIATNIKLIGVCMQALPDILTGMQARAGACIQHTQNEGCWNVTLSCACRKGEGNGCDVSWGIA